MNDDLLAGIRALLAEQQRTNDLLAQLLALSRRPSMSPRDADAAAAVLPEIARVFGADAFEAGDVVDEAGRTAAMRSALLQAVGAESRQRARRLGILLARIQGLDVGGLRVHRAYQGRSGAVWRIVRD